MPLPVVAVDATPVETTASLLDLFIELATVSEHAESDASALLRRNELSVLVATRLTSIDTVVALEADALQLSSHGSLLESSISFCILHAVRSSTNTPLRLVALEQLAIFFSLTLDSAHRARASDALWRVGLPRLLVDECLCDDRIDVSQAVLRLLARWGADPNDSVAQAFFGNGGSRSFSVAECIVAQRETPCSGVVLVRFYELLVMLYTRSPVAAGRCDANETAAALLKSMCDTVSSDDVLLKLNVVELIAQLCASREGVQYCARQGVLKHFRDTIGAEPEDPFARIYATLVVKCIGRFVPLDVYDDVTGECSRWEMLTQLSQLFINASDRELLTEACTTLSSLMVTLSTETAVLLTNTVHHYVLPLIVSHNRALGTAALYAVSVLIRKLDVEPAQTFVDMCTIDNDPLLDVLRARIFRNNEDSKTALRIAAFTCLKAIVEKPWGATALVNSNDWFELLLSRDSELNTAGWHAKYDLLHAIEEQSARCQFGATKTTAIQQYLRQGAIFMARAEPAPEIAMKT